MEKSVDHWALLNEQLSYTESGFQAKREKQLRETLTKAKKSLKKKDWTYYWAYLTQAASQAGFNTQEQEEVVTNNLDDQMRGMTNG